MSVDTPGQELLIQLETALHRLVESFWEEPYRYFTESDAVTSLWQWFAKRPGLARVYKTKDGFETGLLHREYPTFFRFKRADPSRRLEKSGSRGHYDLALVAPSYIQGYLGETVLNRDIEDRGSLSVPPLVAAVEFKLFAKGWGSRRIGSVSRDLGKLRLALQFPADTGTAYLCILQRDVSPTQRRWDRWWPEVKAMLQDYSDISTVVAVCWPQQVREPFVHYHGPWLTAEAGQRH